MSASKAGAAMLISLGSAFIILILSGGFIFVPFDIALNVPICIANAIAFKTYKSQDEKLATTASLILFLTEAAWIAVPIIFFVPVALLLLAIHRVKTAHEAPARIAGSILAFVAVGLSIPFILTLFGIDVSGGGFSFSTEGLVTEAMFVTWPLFFIGRDVIPGILLLLGEGGGESVASGPSYSTYIDATSSR
jgi:hypothetical protein